MRQVVLLTDADIDRMEADLSRVIPSPINDLWDPCRIVATLRALQRDARTPTPGVLKDRRKP